MNPRSSRFVGAVLVAGAVLGTVIGTLALALVWTAAGRVAGSAVAAADGAERAMDATLDLLVVVDRTVVQARSQTDALGPTVDHVADALADTAAATRGFGDMAGGDTAAVITDTRRALESAAASARVVDGVLRVVTALPLVRADYDPPVPLAASLESVGDSLAPLPAQLGAVSRDLVRTADSMEAIRGDLSALAETLDTIDQSLQGTEDVVDAYRAVAVDARAGARTLRATAPSARRWVRVLAVAGFAWLLVAQLGLLTQGLEWWRREDVSAGRSDAHRSSPGTGDGEPDDGSDAR